MRPFPSRKRRSAAWPLGLLEVDQLDVLAGLPDVAEDPHEEPQDPSALLEVQFSFSRIVTAATPLK